MTLLTPELLANIGRQSEPRREIVTRRDIRKYAVATNNPRYAGRRRQSTMKSTITYNSRLIRKVCHLATR